jgi:hypothetical protein
VLRAASLDAAAAERDGVPELPAADCLSDYATVSDWHIPAACADHAGCYHACDADSQPVSVPDSDDPGWHDSVRADSWLAGADYDMSRMGSWLTLVEVGLSMQARHDDKERTTMLRRISLLGMLLVGGMVCGCSQEVGSTETGQSQSGLSSTDQAGPRRMRRQPPKEAFDACKTLAEGATCSVKFHDKTLDGSCKKGPEADSALACAPAKMPPPPEGIHRGPPPEAIDACKALVEGNACSVKLQDRTMDGSCRKGPAADSQLACAPAHMPSLHGAN